MRSKLPDIGRLIGEFIEFLHDHGALNYNRTQIIGHSLGAHLAGYAGKYIRARDALGLDAIVGLDPAGPLFFIDKPDDRLTASDAQYVETLHTTGAPIGFQYPIGSTDFYANWGDRPLGCKNDLFGICSHA